MVLSLLFKASPKDLRMLMIDPKMLELASTRASRTCWRRWSPT
jgi:S-DNA-T family DNA segregation ATPase FtsK/SpoIIIE